MSQPPEPMREVVHSDEHGNITRDISTYATIPQAGETRACTDPWTFAQVKSNGSVRPCCFSGVILGLVTNDVSFNDVYNGEIAARLREELLTGELDKYCRICNMKAITPVADLQKEIADLRSQARKITGSAS